MLEDNQEQPKSMFLGGVRLDIESLKSAEVRVLSDIVNVDAPSTCIRFVNAYSIALSYKNIEYCELLNSGGINLVDSKTVSSLLTARMKYLVPQIRGSDFFKTLVENPKPGLRHFFLGGTNEDLEKLISSVLSQNPVIRIAGHFSPKFKQDFNAEDIDFFSTMIQDSGANIVWVSLGTPKQDFVASAISNAIQVSTVAVGAAFGFYSGTLREAPTYISSLNLEWLYRLLQEPKRLWKRYLLGNTIFIQAVIKHMRKSNHEQ